MKKLLFIIIIFTLGAIRVSAVEPEDFVPHTPTGCPYGDSIPLDSPKCAPPPEIQEPTPRPVTPPGYYGVGK